MLRRIFGPKTEERKKRIGRIKYYELHNLYSSPVIIATIKSRKVRWMRHVARMGEMRNAYKL
jgi:hypothetical protein